MLDTLDTIIAVADTVTTVVDPVIIDPVAPEEEGVWGFITRNLGELVLGLLAFIKVVVNLTPTEKDNQVFGWLDALVNMIIADRKVTKA
jgi:hypothetical protein